MDKPDYVLVYMYSPLLDGEHGREFLLVKKRPAFMKGKLNLPGGKLQEGETSEEAAVRLLHEETGHRSDRPELLGRIKFDCGTKVDCVRVHWVDTKQYNRDLNKKGKNEDFEVKPWSKFQDDPRLLNDLKLVLPLMHMGVKNWSIFDIRRDDNVGDAASFRICFDHPDTIW